MTSRRDDRRASAGSYVRPPMTDEALERLAMHYVARYATTSAKLTSYLKRKVRERAVPDVPTPDIAALVTKIVALGYVDDTAYAEMKTAALGRRGYGGRRIGLALRHAGIGGDMIDEAMARSTIDPCTAINTYLQRRRMGPYSSVTPTREAKQRVMTSLLRAGHSYDDIAQILSGWRIDVHES